MKKGNEMIWACWLLGLRDSALSRPVGFSLRLRGRDWPRLPRQGEGLGDGGFVHWR